MPNIIVNDILPRIQYSASAGQTVFSFPFLMFFPTDINVYRRLPADPPDDLVDILTYNIGYTVFINPPPLVGGTITLLTPASANDIITLVRNQPDQRLNYYIQGGPFISSMVNFDFDQIILMDQQRQMYDEAVGVHYNLNAVITPNVDNYLPVLPPSSVWIKNADNTAIDTASLPAFPVGSLGGNFDHNNRLVRTDISTGENDIAETNLQLVADTINSVAGTWGMSSTDELNISASNALNLNSQKFPTAGGATGTVMGIVAPNVLGYLSVPTTPSPTTVDVIPVFVNTTGSMGDSLFSQSGTNLLLPADPTVALAAATKQYVDAQVAGNVATITGTGNQIDVDSTDPANPVLSLSSTLLAPGTLSAITSVGTGNVRLQGNSLISTNTDGNLNFTPNGTGINVLKNAQVTSLIASQMVATDASKNLVSVNFNPANLPYAVLQSGSPIFGADAGSTDAYAITLNPAPAAYVVGMEVRFSANTGNTAGATLNVNSLGALAILKFHDQALATGDIEVGQISTVIYDGTNWQLQSATAATPGTGTVNSGTINQMAWYAATGAAVSGLATANNGMLVTSGSGVPSISSVPPAAVLANIPGRLLNIRYLTSGTGATYTPTATTTSILVEMMGAGGGGGGVLPGLANFAAAGGGGAGGYCMRYITGVTGGYSATYTVPAGGAGGIGNLDGAAGGTTTYADGTFSMTAIGGAGGGAGGVLNAGSIGGFGGEGNGATGGTIITDGASGGWGMCSNVSGNISQSGWGGNSHFSGGGTDGRVTTAAVQAGVNGTIGSGGGGAVGLASASSANGGGGGAGIIIIYEFA